MNIKYIIHINHQCNKALLHFILSVPRAHILGNSELYVKAGSDIKISCEVTGHKQPTSVKWYHAGNGSGTDTLDMSFLLLGIVFIETCDYDKTINIHLGFRTHIMPG